MKAVVTGGAGFIGSHLVDRLLQDGHKVSVLDDMSTGRIENLQSAMQNPNLTIRQIDVSGNNDLGPLFQDVDWVFHLAALADIVPSIQEPLKYHSANVDGTVSVLDASRKAGIKRFVYAASSSCYGLPNEFPTTEAAPCAPMYPYALTKHIAEQYVMHWGQVYQLPCVSLRLFNVYGPRARTSGTYGAVFGVFLAQKLADKPFTVVGDGNQTRDFTYVSDVTEAFVRAAESDEAGIIMNVGSGDTYSINRLVDLLGGEKVHLPKRPGEPDCTFADISQIRHSLNWVPKVSFEEGVENMLKNIEMWREAVVWDITSIAEATKDWFKHLAENPESNPLDASSTSDGS